MAAVVHGVTLTTTANTATYTTASFAPANGDLLIALVEVSTTADAGEFTDSLGGTWTFIGSAEASGPGLRKMWVYARTAASDGTALTGTMDVTGDNGTGAFIEFVRISGMTKFGATAILQFKNLDNQSSASTPEITFDAAVQAGNPTIVFLVNVSNPAGVTEPSGWTEIVDTGYTSPDTGAQVSSRDSGFTGSTITYGGASASNWGLIAIELDASGGGTTHNAAVAFVAAATAAMSAVMVRGASVGFNGAGTLASTASVLRAAAVSFQGAGTFAGSAHLVHAAAVSFSGAGMFAGSASIVHAASVSFAGAATFASTATTVHGAAVSFNGAATIAADGTIVPAGPQTHMAAVAFAGAAVFSAAATGIRSAQVSYAAAASFGAQAGVLSHAAVSFGAAVAFDASASLTLNAAVSFVATATFSALPLLPPLVVFGPFVTDRSPTVFVRDVSPTVFVRDPS